MNASHRFQTTWLKYLDTKNKNKNYTFYNGRYINIDPVGRVFQIILKRTFKITILSSSFKGNNIIKILW